VEDLRELLFGARNDGGVEAEEQTTQRSHSRSFYKMSIQYVLQTEIFTCLRRRSKTVLRDRPYLPGGHLHIRAIRPGFYLGSCRAWVVEAFGPADAFTEDEFDHRPVDERLQRCTSLAEVQSPCRPRQTRACLPSSSPVEVRRRVV